MKSWHVSPSFASLAETLAASRQEPGRPRRIVLAGGNYFDVALELGPADAGLSIEAAPDSTPILYGGRRITGWERDDDRLFSAPVAGGWDFRMLAVNGRFAPRAKLGPFQHRSVFDVRWMSTTAGGWERKPTEAELTTLVYRPGDLGAWLDVNNAELTVYHQWDESVVGLRAHDPATQTLRFSTPTGHPPGSFGKNAYTVWNVREGLTEPGQWYLDRTRQRVVYWPLPGEDRETVEVIAPTTEAVIRINGEEGKPVTGITLKGLTVAVTTTPLVAGGFGALKFDGAVSCRHVEDCSLVGLTIRNVGGQGIKIQHGRNVRVEDCETDTTGAGGIICAGCDGTTVEKCHVHHNGRSYPSALGIQVTGCDNHVLRNEIHHTTYTGINASGDRSRFEHNLIYDVMEALNDGAAIYVTFCRDFVIRGNVARGASGTLAHAYYLDEQAENCVVEGNLAINTGWPSHNHMARRCVIRGNMFVDDGPARLTFPRCEGFILADNVIVARGGLLVSAPEAGIASMPRNVFFAGTGKLEREILADYHPRSRGPLELFDGSIAGGTSTRAMTP